MSLDAYTHDLSGMRPAVLWFTGLSGSGKSTIAERVEAELLRQGVELEYLDGDRVRDIFPNTGFTKADRDEHIRRIGFLACMLEKHGVVVIASFVSPYADTRREVREECGTFVEIHVATSLEECERRDVKGLYARARSGEIENFTGISDPYEPPDDPELRIDTTGSSIEASCTAVFDYIGETLCPR